MMWGVYKQWVTVINKEREKLFFPVSVDPTYCFLINTEPSVLDRNNPKRIAEAYVVIAQVDYEAFLEHDSCVCCTWAFDNFVPDANYRLGELSDEDRTRVIETVIHCPDLPLKVSKHIVRFNAAIARPLIRG